MASLFDEEPSDDEDVDVDDEENSSFFFQEEEEEEEDLPDFLEVVEEDEDDEEETGAILRTQNRAEFLSTTEIRHLTAAFDTCDKTGTGELNFADFMKCLSVMGKKVTKREAQKYFEAMDEDKSGFISLEEWIGFYANNMVRDARVLIAFVGFVMLILLPSLQSWQQFEVDEKELLNSFIGLWQQPTALHPETSQRYEEEEFIPKEKLFEIMTKYGDKLTDEEAAEMIRECNPDEVGRIFFENYRHMLIDG
jgi:Ca2+-binding EF-hand superfamily protein